MLHRDLIANQIDILVEDIRAISKAILENKYMCEKYQIDLADDINIVISSYESKKNPGERIE